MNKLIPLKELFTPVYGVNLELVNVEECEKKIQTASALFHGQSSIMEYQRM